MLLSMNHTRNDLREQKRRVWRCSLRPWPNARLCKTKEEGSVLGLRLTMQTQVLIPVEQGG